MADIKSTLKWTKKVNNGAKLYYQGLCYNNKNNNKL